MSKYKKYALLIIYGKCKEYNAVLYTSNNTILQKGGIPTETRFDTYDRYESYFSLSDSPCVLFKNTKKEKDDGCANWHNEPELQLCTDGEGYLVVNGEEYPFQKGYIAVIHPDEIHYTGSHTEITFISIILNDSFCRNADIDCSKLPFRRFIRDENMQSQIADIIEIWREPPSLSQKARMQIGVLGILVKLLEYRTEPIGSVSKSAHAFEPVKRTVQYIRTHYAEKMTLDRLSKVALTDKYRLSHMFKSYTGLTIMQYANQYRCEAAKDFIRSGKTVRETAELCGFNNLSFFTRMFKKCTGKMPSDYKKVR